MLQRGGSGHFPVAPNRQQAGSSPLSAAAAAPGSPGAVVNLGAAAHQSGSPGSLTGSPVRGYSGAQAAKQQQQQQQSASAEERAAALMHDIALEGLSPEASMAALQQLNYDLTMQLGLYQQMVARLKDAMEAADLEKAELEAEKMMLQQQMGLGGMEGNPAAAGATGQTVRERWGSWWRGSRAQRSSRGFGDGDMIHTHGSIDLGDEGMVGLEGSFNGSRRSSISDMDALSGGDVRSSENGPSAGDGDAAGEGGSSEEQQKERAARERESKERRAAVAASGNPAAAGPTGGRWWRGRQQQQPAPNSAEALGKELKEAKRQAGTLADENKFLVGNLVEIKMELAEAQGGGSMGTAFTEVGRGGSGALASSGRALWSKPPVVPPEARGRAVTSGGVQGSQLLTGGGWGLQAATVRAGWLVGQVEHVAKGLRGWRSEAGMAEESQAIPATHGAALGDHESVAEDGIIS